MDYEVETNLVVKEDEDSVLVLILKCETKPCDNNITNLKWVFSENFFTVHVCAIDLPKTIPDTAIKDQYIEMYNMKKLLIYASKGPPNIANKGIGWKNMPTIIIKDSSICNINPVDMKNKIKRAIKLGGKADLYFLCKWNDACSKFSNLGNVDIGTKLKWTTNPTSTQCIMYTPKARDYIIKDFNLDTSYGDYLNSLISSMKLLAVTFVPNVVHYDIDLAVSSSDYAKLNECSQSDIQETSGMVLSMYIWLTITLILFCIVMWILMQSAHI